jgi:nucleoside phosphorylase
MKVLVTFAVEAEFAPWRALRSFKRVRINETHWSHGLEVYEAQIGQCIVWVFLTGIGIKAFDFGVVSCLKNAGVDVVLSSGLAGSLNPELVPERVVAAKRVGTMRDASGLPITTTIVDFAQHRGATLIEVLLTSDHIIETQEEKSRLANFGEAVDMESFHVVQEFSDHNIPVAVVRAISDGSDQDLPVNFEKCLTPQGQVKAGPLLKELLARPSRVPELIRFGLQSRNATRKLASFLDSFIEALTPGVLIRKDTAVSAS